MQRQPREQPRRTLDAARPVLAPLKQPVTVLGTPSVYLQDGCICFGDAHSSSQRTYAILKVLGQGSFGSVTLCDWIEGPPVPLSSMQRGKVRPEWVGKRLVAIKKMRRAPSDWEKCNELKSLRALAHPNIVRLHDFFVSDRVLYLVMESMEGNLLQLLDSRKRRVLAGGLVASIFYQVASGLECVHAHGWFHRDMKPDNLLVTTTGLHDYHPMVPAGGRMRTDVVVIVKVADFGLACQTNKKTLRTPYVSTRWYRAPEVVLHGREYSNPVDMWAFGAILAELVNLRPLFPGKRGEIDQMARICEVLGDPSDDHGLDEHGLPLGGGAWPRGIEMATAVGCVFPKIPPQHFESLFGPEVPETLINCIKGLLRYDPARRLTSRQCLEHLYLTETARLAKVPLDTSSSRKHHKPTPGPSSSQPPKVAPMAEPVAAHEKPTPLPTILVERSAALPIASPNAMEISPRSSLESIAAKPDGIKALKLKKSSKWGLSAMFGGEKSQSLRPIEGTLPSGSSSGSPEGGDGNLDNRRAAHKEATRLQREAEMQRRELTAKNLREQARAVVQNRADLELVKTQEEIEWQSKGQRLLEADIAQAAAASSRGKERAVTRREHAFKDLPVPGHSSHEQPQIARFSNVPNIQPVHQDLQEERIRSHKARRRDHDDDHSMSSFDTYGADRISFMSSTTADSNFAGPSRVKHHRHAMASSSSLATSVDYAASARGSLSFEQEHRLADDFRHKASFQTPSPPPSHNGPPSWSSHSVRRPSPLPPRDKQRGPLEKNTMFDLPPLINPKPGHTRLPPFSHLEAIAGAYQPFPGTDNS